MIRTIELTPQFQAYASTAAGGFRLRVDVTSATNVEPEVFLYLIPPVAPGASAPICKFQKICSPADVAAYPTLAQVAAAPAISDPWLRAAYFDLIFASRAEAEEAWAIIQADVKSLLAAFAAQDELESLAPVTFSAGTA